MTTSIVDPDFGVGTDYISLNAWEGQNRDLVTATDDEIAECRASSGSADSAAVNIDGWTTSATYDITVQTSGANRHSGVFSTSHYRLTSTGSLNLDINDQYVTILGIQFQMVLASDGNSNIAISRSPNQHFGYCIAYNSGAANQGVGFFALGGSGNVYNCIADGIIRTGTGGVGFYMRTASATTNYYNCTAHNCQTGFNEHTGTMNVYNSLAFKNDNDFGGSPTVIDYCASDDGDDTGSNGVTISQTADDYAALVVDAAGGDFNVTDADSELEAAGTDDPSSGLYTDDIKEDARTSAWDIGAFEFIGGGGGGGIMNQIQHSNLGNDLFNGVII
ncbi:MAG: hypothetical protein GY928_34510 [Colwellia sp.]|nr:hypothetical protein [Colwellia sp.]